MAIKCEVIKEKPSIKKHLNKSDSILDAAPCTQPLQSSSIGRQDLIQLGLLTWVGGRLINCTC